MKYKIYCLQRQQYFAEEAVFDRLEDIKEQLRDYHSVDNNEPELLKKMSLYELCDVYDWRVHDTNGEEVDIELLKNI